MRLSLDQQAGRSRLPRVAPDGELAALIASRTEELEGGCTTVYPGLHYYRVSRPTTFQKTHAFGATLIVAAQGEKVARFDGFELRYDPSRYLVVTGEGASFVGTVVEASPQHPYLAMCLELPAEIVAKVLLALADADVDPGEDSVPAFTANLDPELRAGVLRLLRALDDPLERQVLAPLAIEELVFRLLRSEAAAVIRRTVGRSAETRKIEEAMRFMREHARTTLSVEAIARQVAMSPSHFAHRFRAIARVTPKRFLKELRMKDARTLLLSDGVRVREAAWTVGYESASHFSRDFKSYFGSTPAEYVRRFRA